MSMLLESCAGHVHVFTQGKGRRGAGFYNIEPNIYSSSGKCLITGIQMEYREIVQPTVTLDNTRTIYTFGSAWNEASVSGLLLLGDNASGGKAVTDLLSWYEKNNVSALQAPVKLSLADRGVAAFVTGLQVGEVDPNFNKQAFTIMLLLSND